MVTRQKVPFGNMLGHGTGVALWRRETELQAAVEMGHPELGELGKKNYPAWGAAGEGHV